MPAMKNTSQHLAFFLAVGLIKSFVGTKFL
jgi:hypothetical protein